MSNEINKRTKKQCSAVSGDVNLIYYGPPDRERKREVTVYNKVETSGGCAFDDILKLKCHIVASHDNYS